MTGGGILAKREKSFTRVDAMSPAMRECVHEFGEPIVQACLTAGVHNPVQIRQLVHEIWEGARTYKQRRPPMGSLDWLLVQIGADLSAKTLVRMLRANNFYIVPGAQKHRLRLKAAIRAGMHHVWPDLDTPPIHAHRSILNHLTDSCGHLAFSFQSLLFLHRVRTRPVGRRGLLLCLESR